MEYTNFTNIKAKNVKATEKIETNNLKVTGKAEGLPFSISVEAKTIADNESINYQVNKMLQITASAASKVLTMSGIPDNTAFLIQNVGDTNDFTLKHGATDTGVTIAKSSLYLVTYSTSTNELVIVKLN